eukprot:COSAG02_NODE_2990_length_7607_cov_3.437134_8_plen_406_part_00
MFLAGSDSEAEEDYYTSASAASKSAASSAVLSSSDAARIAVHCNLRRVSREPPWLAALVARRAEQDAESVAIEYASQPTPTPASSPAAHTAATGGGVQPRRRRNSLSDALRVLLPGDRPSADEEGQEGANGRNESTTSTPASTREVLYGALRDAGFGRELCTDDTVVVGGDRVPRTLCKLGEALRKAGGIDEPRIFARRPSLEEMLEVVRQLRLAEVPTLPRVDSANGVHEPRDSRVSGRPHAIAALIKEWLLQLPGGLLQLTDAQLAEVYGAKEPLVPTRLRLDEMRGTLCGDAWRWFVRLLAEIQQASPRNNMPARELAIVLAPLVVRPKAPHISASVSGTEADDRSTSAADDCEREMHVMRFIQHCVAVMARKQLSLVRSPQANRPRSGTTAARMEPHRAGR